MTLYLQTNGTTDYVLTPSTIKYDTVVIDGLLNLETYSQYAFTSSSWLGRLNANTTNTWFASSATVTGFTGTGNRCTFTISANTKPATNDIGVNAKIYSTSNGKIYDVKLYLGGSTGTLVAHYDMSTGTVQDVSGNGNNATLTGGTWVDDGAGGTGTNATITSVIANATASSLAPTITTQQQVSVSGVIANANTSALAPSVSTSAGISSVVASSTVNVLSPTVSTSVNTVITSVIASAQATALIPQAGTFTNINITATASNSTASANNPSASTIQNISLGAPISNAVATALIPNVGLSTSANIAAVIASLVVDGIAPSVNTTQGTNINSVVAGVNAGAMIPTLQRDMVIFAVVGNSQAAALVPSINWISTAIISTTYLQGSRILNVNLQGNQVLDINLKGVV